MGDPEQHAFERSENKRHGCLLCTQATFAIPTIVLGGAGRGGAEQERVNQTKLLGVSPVVKLLIILPFTCCVHIAHYIVDIS